MLPKYVYCMNNVSQRDCDNNTVLGFCEILFRMISFKNKGYDFVDKNVFTNL